MRKLGYIFIFLAGVHALPARAQAITPAQVLESPLWRSYVTQFSANFEAPVNAEYLNRKCESYLVGKETSIADGIDLCIGKTLEEIDMFGTYDNPPEFERKQKLAQQPSVGFGLELRNEKKVGEPLVVIAPIANGPGYRAGIRADDAILAVDGAPIGPLSLNDAFTALRGAAGSRALLQIRRGESVLELSVVREEIRVNYANVKQFDGGLLYCRISFFRKDLTTEQLYAKLKTAFSERVPRALIIDLRTNLGGALDEVIETASLFVAPNTRLLASLNQQGQEYISSKPLSISATGRAEYMEELLRKLPVYVLVNDRTADGAEALAVILKQHRSAIIVGTRTAGLDFVRKRIHLENQAAITVTNARLTATSVQGWRVHGVPVDVQVPKKPGLLIFGDLTDDTVLMAALQRARKD